MRGMRPARRESVVSARAARERGVPGSMEACARPGETHTTRGRPFHPQNVFLCARASLHCAPLRPETAPRARAHRAGMQRVRHRGHRPGGSSARARSITVPARLREPPHDEQLPAPLSNAPDTTLLINVPNVPLLSVPSTLPPPSLRVLPQRSRTTLGWRTRRSRSL